MALTIAQLIERLTKEQEIIGTDVPVFIQMGEVYTDLSRVEPEFHDDWKHRFPEGRFTLTLKG